MSGSPYEAGPPLPREEAPPLPSMAEAADAAIAALTAGGVSAAGALSSGGSRSSEGEPRRKKSKWDDEPTRGTITVGGVPVQASFVPGKSSSPGGGPFLGMRGDHTKSLSIPLNCKGRVIGRGGEQINKMRAETQAYITVKHDDGDEMATVSLKGTRAQVEHAEVLIFECLKSGRPQEWEQRIIDVPPHCIGETIGSGGCNLLQISDRSGCKVKFIHASELDPTEDPAKQVCVIRGPPEKINMAEMLVNERVAEVQQQHIQKRTWPPQDPYAGPGQHGYGGIADFDPSVLQASVAQQSIWAEDPARSQNPTVGSFPTPPGLQALVQPPPFQVVPPQQASSLPLQQQDWSHSGWQDPPRKPQGSGYRPAVMPGDYSAAKGNSNGNAGNHGYHGCEWGSMAQAKKQLWGSQNWSSW